jgi:hypothetical protein
MRSIKIIRDSSGATVKAPLWISKKEAWLQLEAVFPGQYKLENVKKIDENGREYKATK